MSAVAIVDTSIFCNVLNIPHMNGERDQVMKEMTQYLNTKTTLLLPMAAVYETGNHIAHLSNGSQRHKVAQRFVEQVKMAIAGDAPWQAMQAPTMEEVGELVKHIS